jgi:hypothetical protein
MAKSQYKDIVKGIDNVNVIILDNGYNLEFTGYNSKGDWVTSKIIVPTVDELCNHIREVTQMTKD